MRGGSSPSISMLPVLLPLSFQEMEGAPLAGAPQETRLAPGSFGSMNGQSDIPPSCISCYSSDYAKNRPCLLRANHHAAKHYIILE